ncbi:hypothetical protein CIW83_03040 [Tissierella sp. P1]|uniref:hypothetical protein n=1 Tax=Tissierella sp. P1 TaxID=1280483 RepID=UPI000BA00DD5|nr:hypothetical protein [Tissierella sp. P1]OZV13536.1 hypothetical protein CIW83_03040 [Tissierella sp. P1]
MKDGYKEFFDYFNIKEDEIINYGLNSVITIDETIAKENWELLKGNILSNKQSFIRGYGRDATGTKLFTDLYISLFNNYNIVKDPTNNANPQKLIYELTGFKRNRDIFNYQVSHIFGRTKNPFAFCAPWNIIYIPKILDPFTGHESKGKLTEKFTNALKNVVYNKFSNMIVEFNEIVTDKEMLQLKDNHIMRLKKDRIIEFKRIEQFEKDVENEFAPILI